jgi:hypothetical protein
LKKRTETNTLALIRKWSMAGARSDLDRHFGSPVDIHAMVAERDGEQANDGASDERAPLFLKPADEDGWRPLLLGVSGSA